MKSSTRERVLRELDCRDYVPDAIAPGLKNRECGPERAYRRLGMGLSRVDPFDQQVDSLPANHFVGLMHGRQGNPLLIIRHVPSALKTGCR
jgi:hypothetical protein